MEKLNTFLRLVKTVLVGYPTSKLDRIPFICYFFKIYLHIYTFYNGIDYVKVIMFYATDILFICLMTCVDNSPSWGLLRLCVLDADAHADAHADLDA